MKDINFRKPIIAFIDGCFVHGLYNKGNKFYWVNRYDDGSFDITKIRKKEILKKVKKMLNNKDYWIFKFSECKSFEAVSNLILS